MIIIAGLGNPGSKYDGNRHNIGFMAVDAIYRRHAFGPWTKKFKAEIADGEIAGEKVLLMKPLTFMNLSGEAVGEAMRFYKLTPADLIVVHDELDLLPGKVRMKTGGGNGGHNGLKSIDAHCGKDYRRLRLGIGHPGDKDRVSGYVLGDFAKVDRDWLDPLIDAIADNADLLPLKDESKLMNKLTLATGGKAEPEKPAKPPKKPGGGQSHIRQARGGQPTKLPGKLPTKGPMADMLKKMFGNKDE
ncbi:aminoacyl-tRNA hydrolase [Rhizobium halophytocola]|uniref:Peptidyl-tRNA hydrolase n=1 Tax=Rhizobium halophytocola TaxID=735519 RepID=A0ABS4E3U6_9HYPH|nr:aminoacyl-tRNA hydrolase [Rhizobium halophytocola]MBP1852607.1 PTH1 family peptidyl-tRNA hydrolase [Rhizobium halophytocola]